MMSEHVAEKYPRCPRCGSPLEGRNPFLPSYGRYECGSYDRDDTATIECYRRQLARAQTEVERLRRERDVLAEAVMGWQRYLERDVGTERVHVRTLEAHGRALALIAGEKDGVVE